MKVDFKAIKCKDVTGKIIIADVSKTLGNSMYRTALTDDIMTLGKEIYDKGQIDVNPVRAKAILKCINENGFFAFIKAGVNPILDKIIKADKGLEKKSNK